MTPEEKEFVKRVQEKLKLRTQLNVKPKKVFDKKKDVFEELNIKKILPVGSSKLRPQTSQEVLEAVETSKVKRELQREAIKRTGRYIQKGMTAQTKPSVRKLDTKISGVARKIVMGGIKKAKKIKSQREKAYNRFLKERLKQIKLQKQIQAQQTRLAVEQIAEQQRASFEQPDDMNWVDEPVNLPDRDFHPEIQSSSKLQNILARAKAGFGNLGSRFGRMGQPRIQAPHIRQPQQTGEVNLLRPVVMPKRKGQMFGENGISLMGRQPLAENVIIAQKLNFVNDNQTPKIIRTPNTPLQKNKFSGRVNWF